MIPVDYVKSVDGLSTEQKRLYEAKNMAKAQDHLEEGMLKVPVKKALANYADPQFAQENVYFVENWNKGTAILCDRGSLREASACFTGMVWRVGCMPFVNNRDITRPEPWAPHGSQYLILTTLGLPESARVKEAMRNIHVMAGLRKRVDGLKPLRDFEVGGEDCICLHLPFSTKPEHVMDHEKIVPLPAVLDPRGIVAAYVQRKTHVITNRNLLDVWLAEPTGEAGKYQIDPASPEILRQGQIVRVEVVFRIVPAGKDHALRIDMKSVVIINTDVAANIAFAEMMDKQKEQALERGTFSLGGPGPSGTVIQPARDFNKRTFAEEKNDQPQDVQMKGLEFEPAPLLAGFRHWGEELEEVEKTPETSSVPFAEADA